MTRIATLGPEGSFSEEAATKYSERFDNAEIILLRDPEEIISLTGDVDLGLVAIENSLEGSIGHTLDLMREMDTVICDEVILRVRHFLMGNVEISSVKKIFSHPAALAQCRRFLKQEFEDCELIETSSTAQGGRRASEDPESAAIASLRAAKIYGLKVLAEEIQDQDSFTRFIVVGREVPSPTGGDKTSLIFAVKDLPGALYKALAPFASRGLNLTKIESRPSKKALGEYVFFVDFSGHVSEAVSKEALADLSRVCTSIKVLGSYPAATFPEPPTK